MITHLEFFELIRQKQNTSENFEKGNSLSKLWKQVNREQKQCTNRNQIKKWKDIVKQRVSNQARMREIEKQYICDLR